MTTTIKEVRAWMLRNKLKINDAKTECILIGSKPTLAEFKKLNINITVGESSIIPSESVKNLGAALDCDHSMSTQITNMIRSAYFHLHRISKVRRYIDHETCAKAIHACVTSRLDYHNALLTGVPDYQRRKLELVQNHAAQLLSGTPIRMHIQPVLCQLHWLPIQYRIQYKVLSFIHQAVHCDEAPAYLKEFCTIYTPARNLRSANDPYTLTIPPTPKRKVGNKSFPVYGAELWNKLPLGIRHATSKNAYKSMLKTHLFKEAFDV